MISLSTLLLTCVKSHGIWKTPLVNSTTGEHKHNFLELVATESVSALTNDTNIIPSELWFKSCCCRDVSTILKIHYLYYWVSRICVTWPTWNVAILFLASHCDNWTINNGFHQKKKKTINIGHWIAIGRTLNLCLVLAMCMEGTGNRPTKRMIFEMEPKRESWKWE
jgi:hypothetical protein